MDERDPSWSHDGQFLVYARQVSSTDYDLWIYKVGNPNDTSDDEEYALLPYPGSQELRPAWSPDGTRIAFVTGSPAQIAAVNVSTDATGRVHTDGPFTLLTHGSYTNFDPTWSPDSQQIAFSTTRNGARDIYRMNAILGDTDPQTFVRLTTNTANDRNPSWSPEGQRIAFTSERDGNTEVYVMSAVSGEADTTSLVRITNDAGSDDDAAWQLTCEITIEALYQYDSRWDQCGLGEPRCDSEIPSECLTNADSRLRCGITDETCSGTIVACAPAGPVDQCIDECVRLKQNQRTIRSTGCVLTCATMIANALLHSNLVPPDLNNQWSVFNNFQLTGSHRIKTNDLDWSRVATAITRHAGSSFFRTRFQVGIPDAQPCINKDDSRYAYYIDFISDCICKGVPVAVRVDGVHTVVANSVMLDANGKTILIRDPGKGKTSLNEYNCINYVDVVQAGTPAGGTLRIVSNSPVEMVIQDSSARRCGFDPRTGQGFSEIPGATYSVEWPDDLDLLTDPAVLPILDRNNAQKVVYLPATGQTDFQMEVIGTGQGEARLTVEQVSDVDPPQPLAIQTLQVSTGSSEFISVSPVYRPGDFNANGNVDMEDLSVFSLCATGPNVPYSASNLPVGCVLAPDGQGSIAADLDRDGDVDQEDFGIFQRCFSGIAIADPNCAN